MQIEVKKEKMTNDIIKEVIEIDKGFYLNFDYNVTQVGIIVDTTKTMR